MVINAARYRMSSSDGSLKYRGMALEGEYYLRWLDNFKGSNVNVVHDLFDHGYQLQASAMVMPKTLQVYLGDSKIFGQFGKPYDVRLGTNWYVFKNRVVRWNTEAMYLHNSPVGYTAVPFALGGKGWVFLQLLRWRSEKGLRILREIMRTILKDWRQTVQKCAPLLVLLMVLCSSVSAQVRASTPNEPEVNDSHFHLTNYIQEGTDIHRFLQIMGTKVGRVALLASPCSSNGPIAIPEIASQPTTWRLILRSTTTHSPMLGSPWPTSRSPRSSRRVSIP